jgi:hypothetical protein
VTLIVYVDQSTIRPGKREALERELGALARLVEAEEPQIVAYAVHLSDDGTTLSVLHAHRDVASLERHFVVAGPAFSKFRELIEMQSIDVYGPVPDAIVETLRGKAALLGTGLVRRHGTWFGFDRLNP